MITHLTYLKWIIPVIIALLIGCYGDSILDDDQQAPFLLQIPQGFPYPDIPEDNALTAERIALGKKLFYDPILSLDSTISCGSCHLATVGFATHDKISRGIQGRLGKRNIPTLTNVAYHPYFFAEGGSPTLELQVIGPIENHDEMGFNAADLAKRLQDHPTYDLMAQEAYSRDMDMFVLVRAIAAFERTMISGNSRYDQYKFQGKTDALSDSEINGMNLFFSERLGCANCHSGFNFTNYEFENIGLYERYDDLGRYRVSLKEEDKGSFKVPTLRNITLTAPYMHDGSMESLEEVIEHFQMGGQNHPQKSKHLRPFSLSNTEQQDLIHFLHTLTDSTFILNPDFVP